MGHRFRGAVACNYFQSPVSGLLGLCHGLSAWIWMSVQYERERGRERDRERKGETARVRSDQDVCTCHKTCMYVVMYVCNVSVFGMRGSMCVCMHVCIYVCMYVYMYICMYVCICVRCHLRCLTRGSRESPVTVPSWAGKRAKLLFRSMLAAQSWKRVKFVFVCLKLSP